MRGKYMDLIDIVINVIVESEDASGAVSSINILLEQSCSATSRKTSTSQKL